MTNPRAAAFGEERGPQRRTADVHREHNGIGRRRHARNLRRARSVCAQQTGPASQLRGQRLDRAQGWRADVVLHAFDVVIDHALIETEQSEKIGQQFVPARDIARERFARAWSGQGRGIFRI